MNPVETLRQWWKRRQMWQHRTAFTWPRKQSKDPVVQAVRRWKDVQLLEPK